MNRSAGMLVRDEGVAGSNPATPTRLRTGMRTDTIDFPGKQPLKEPKTGRPAKGPRLYLRTDRDGAKSWIIRDGGRDMRTGCQEGDDLAALAALAAYNAGEQILTRAETIDGLVYFVTCSTSLNYPIKIGWTKSLSNRMTQMQGGNPNVLTVLATVPGTYKDERHLHSVFRHLHIRGEWFRRSDDLMRHIEALPSFAEVFGAEEFAAVRA